MFCFSYSYRKRLKAQEEGVTITPSIVPPLPPSEITPAVAPNDSKLPPGVSPELVLFCRKIYDFRSKKIQVPNKWTTFNNILDISNPPSLRRTRIIFCKLKKELTPKLHEFLCLFLARWKVLIVPRDTSKGLLKLCSLPNPNLVQSSRAKGASSVAIWPIYVKVIIVFRSRQQTLCCLYRVVEYVSRIFEVICYSLILMMKWKDAFYV